MFCDSMLLKDGHSHVCFDSSIVVLLLAVLVVCFCFVFGLFVCLFLADRLLGIRQSYEDYQYEIK